MANDTQLVLRVPQDVAERLKAYAEALSAQAGVPVTVAAAHRKLLIGALEAVGHGGAEKKRGKR